MHQVKRLTLQHDGLLTIAVGNSRKETAWKNRELLWSDLLGRLRETRRTGETFAEYQAMPKAERDGIKDVGGFVGGPLKGGRRKCETVSWRQIVTLDADFIKGDLWAGIETIFDYGCAAYTTHSHSSEHPRIRLLIPLQRPVSAEEYPAIGRALAAIVGINFFDDTTYEPHRLMYWPSTSDDGEFFFYFQDAAWVDPDAILGRYPDWRDSSYWPESDRQQKGRKRQADKAGHPLEKPGVIGAFCRAYTIPEAIETFLEGVYGPAGLNRYTYLEGSTSGGLVLYDGGLFCYSHHGTDPIGGRLVNAFDLVRLHKFGLQDEDEDEDTRVAELPSFKAMQEFALKQGAVKKELAESKRQETEEDFDDWMERLTFTKNGDLEKTITNLELVLRHDPALQGIAYNDFMQVPALLTAVPWRKPEDRNGPRWSDADDASLRGYLERFYNIYSVSKTYDAFSMVSQERCFHPIRNFLHSLPPWDGVQRVDRLLVDYLGAEEGVLSRAFARKTLVAAIARVMIPGIKFETMLVLVGPQGCGKSTLFNKLARPWFSDNLMISDMKDKTAVEKIQGYWIIESGELAGLRKTEEEMVKGFLSREQDVVRFAYERRSAELPRQCIIVGSTNRMQGFLRDQTGNRRFWPVYVRKVPFNQSSWTLTDSTVAQIWAEAMKMYHGGESIILTPEEEALAAKAQKEALETDERASMVEQFLDTILPLTWHGMSLEERRAFLDGEERLKEGILRDRVCAQEIWCECFCRRESEFDHMRQREIYGILTQLPGWEPYEGGKKGQLRFSLYGVKRAYVRSES